MNPIFFAWTRSFWLGVLAVVTLVAGDSELMAALSQSIALVVGQPFAVVDPIVGRILPALAILGMMHQRRGNNRPYTLKATRETLA